MDYVSGVTNKRKTFEYLIKLEYCHVIFNAQRYQDNFKAPSEEGGRGGGVIT